MAGYVVALVVAGWVLMPLGGKEPGFARVNAPSNPKPAYARGALKKPAGVLDVFRERFDLGRLEEVDRLLKRLGERIVEAEIGKEAWDQRRAAWRAEKALEEMTMAELKRYYSEPPGFISNKELRGLKALRRLGKELRNELGEAPARGAARGQGIQCAMMELAAAIRNNRRSPAPAALNPFSVPWLLWDYLRNPIGKGRRPASNLKIERGFDADLSEVDPAASTFWTRPKAVSEAELRVGFGRSAAPGFHEKQWRYAGPKTSYGGGPGFEAVDGERRIKVKFTETVSEPFAARIFFALGFNVDATDHVRGLRMAYDRRYFREFHLRKEVAMKVQVLPGLTAGVMQLQRRFDPFDFVKRAVMRDGTALEGRALRERLFLRSGGDHPEDDPGNFRREVEAGILFLEFEAANVQAEDSKNRSVGPWEFEGLGHEDRRELRGAGLLAAWLGWFDARFENTRLRLAERGSAMAIKHYFTDLGGGLGGAQGLAKWKGELPNEFPWHFTEAPGSPGKGRMRRPFRIVQFRLIEDAGAFEKMTWDDARWMARLIGQLSEAQIRAALTGAGTPPADLEVYAAKLIRRRDRMMADLGLASEIPPLRQ